MAACLLVAGLLGATLWPSGHGPHTSGPYASATLAGPGGGWDTGAGLSLSLGVPIQEIEVGRRVLAELPEGVESERGEGDIYGEPDATWRRIKPRAEKVDGSFAEVELLRPISWLEGQDARVGATVDISVPECGIDGNADVLAIEPCPPIPPGAGRVVTGTFAHQSATVVDVHVEGLDGPIGTTANHPFWSEDRQEFVRADDLQPGERLRTLTSPLPMGEGPGVRAPAAAQVIAVVPRATPEPVYNLEVQYAHVYHVAAEGVLVHNGKSKACKTLAGNVRTGAGRDHITYRGFKGGKPYTGYASAPSSSKLTPDEILSRRYSGKVDEVFDDTPEILYHGTGVKGRNTARGVEQHSYKSDVSTFGKDGVANHQNPVSSRNPKKDAYGGALAEWLENLPLDN